MIAKVSYDVQQMISGTATLARGIYAPPNTDGHAAWLAERYRLAGLIWAVCGLHDANGATTFGTATEIARRLAKGESLDGMGELAEYFRFANFPRV